ncbi:DUF3823 domain-containing protein [Chitinophaga filiformis]|uniref:DUF3823 domain-containing protein n=1 Tax=Chitinophaga filiformis TaxID=104663 RepID=A0ABY4I958_CHIFI|nr:DUF3823 domain-containing protein [Chitinophaga filiformis]UPK72633.1 DUF3823 domain-containing protein [Chitinophaga filiformis]
MNKILPLPFIIMLLCTIATGCKKDNYEKPGSILSGRVVYNKEAVGVRSNGVQLELWQHGFQLFTKIPVYIAQDGTFSASLFDGDYKLVLLPGNGPWVNNTDSVDITVNGSTTVEVPVQPYFIIKNARATKTGTTVNATFTIERINTSHTLESATLYLGKTNIADAVNNLKAQVVGADALGDITGPVTISTDIPSTLTGETFFFARIGVKTAGVGEQIYTQPIKIE